MTDLAIPSVPPLPHPRRVITGHNPDGKAIFIKDEAVEPIFWSPESVNPVYGFYRTEETPAVIDSEISGEWVDHIAQNRKLSSPEGSTFSTIDLAPGQVVPMHRTGSIDYAIVAKGSIVLELDNGERRVLKEGDVVVQRGTNHSWRNETDQWARTYFVIIGAQPIKVKGEALPVVDIGPKKALE